MNEKLNIFTNIQDVRILDSPLFMQIRQKCQHLLHHSEGL